MKSPRFRVGGFTLYALAFKDSTVKKGIVYFFGGGGKKIEFDLTKQTTFDISGIVTKIKNKEFEPNQKKL